MESKAALRDAGIAFDRLLVTDAVAARRRWRETFAARVHAATGEWIHAKLDWHAFSFDFVRCLARDPGVEAYRAAFDALRQGPYARSFLVLPESTGPRDEMDGVAWWCKATTPPLMSDLGADWYLVPATFAWTMAFTHEDASGFGPYFTTAA